MTPSGFIVLCVLKLTLGIPLNQFYPFGDGNAEITDSQVTKGDETTSPAIAVQGTYIFFDQQRSTVYVNTNGAISFGTPIGSYFSNPTLFGGNIPLVAPFWANIDTTPSQGGRIWYRESTDSSLLSRANTDIQNFFSVTSFTASHLFIVTWDHVGYYNQQFDLINTFQCVLVTDGTKLFAIFLYADRQLQWFRHDRSATSYAQVGFNAGDSASFMTLPESHTAAIGDIAIISNVIVKRGYWIYQISGSDIAEGRFPPPTVTVTAPSSQIVGQPLTLECNVTTVRGITSRVDIMWSNDGTELKKVIGASSSSITSSSTVYTDTYTIEPLTVADDNKVYHCEMLINAHPPITMLNRATLDVVVPPPTITTSPSDTVQGAIVGDPLLVQCIVDTVDGVEPSLVNISWMGPGGDLIVNTSRVTVSQITSSGNTYKSTLHFTSLFEDDEGMYTCHASIFETSSSHTVILQSLDDFTVQRSFRSVLILEGQSVTLSCSPSIIEVGLTWLHNGTNIADGDITFSPPVLDHNHLIIENALFAHSGVYTCIATVGELTAEQSITVTVLPVCKNDFSEALFWPNSRQDSLVAQSCSQLHPSFRSGVNIGRQCRSDGSWSPVDLRNCTMFIGSKPVVIVYFTVTISNTDLMSSVSTSIVNNVWSHLHNSLSATVSVPINRTWEHSSRTGLSLLSFAMSFNLEEISVANNIQANLNVSINAILPANAELTAEGFQVLMFQPELNCSCSFGAANHNRTSTVCTGPSITPCLCDFGGCMCNSPTFVGDGSVCGLDSDSDGFPDVALDCDEPSCEKDVCPEVYNVDSDGIQQSKFCEVAVDAGFVGCQFEQDTKWNITWLATEVDKVAIQKCPGESEAEGLARRKCIGDREWESPDMSQCKTIEQLSLLTRAIELNNLVNNIFVDDDRDKTVMFMPEDVVEIMVDLDAITGSSEPLLPNDVPTPAEILDIIQLLTEAARDEIGQSTIIQIVENMVNILDGMFDERNDVSFQQMATKEDATAISALLQKNVEKVGILFSTTFGANGNESVQAALMRRNIAIEVQIPTEEELLNTESIDFPSDPTIYNNHNFYTEMIPIIEIPSAVALEQLRNQGKQTVIVSGAARNIHLATDSGTKIETPILSSQISVQKTNLGDERVLLSFNIGRAENRTRFNVRCVFFDFEDGRFSKDGIRLITNSDGVVQCTSSHLTSFTVLADASEKSGQSEELFIVSYVGCGILIACLTFTLVVLVVLYKNIFNTVPDFIHLNLSIALLLGLITFVSGIETATDYRASCLIVAILLHYFLMVVLSWMLCEGILLLIWLNFVLYEGILKTRKFFMILGWGLPLPIVIISSAVSHEQYGTDDWCWISEGKGVIWAFIAPMLLIILINGFILAVILYKIFTTNKSTLIVHRATDAETLKALVKAAVVLLPLLGLTWVFGLLAVNENSVMFAWIFALLKIVQGALIVFVHIIMNKQFLKLVRNFRGKDAPSSATTIDAWSEPNVNRNTTSTLKETIESQSEAVSPSPYGDRPKFYEYVMSPNLLSPVVIEAQIIKPKNHCSCSFETFIPEEDDQQTNQQDDRRAKGRTYICEILPELAEEISALKEIQEMNINGCSSDSYTSETSLPEEDKPPGNQEEKEDRLHGCQEEDLKITCL